MWTLPELVGVFTVNRRYRRRCEGEATLRGWRQRRKCSRESPRSAKPEGIRQERWFGKTQRTKLVIVRDDVVTELIVRQGSAHAECAVLSEEFADPSVVIRGSVGEGEARREVFIIRIPPGRLAIRRAI